METHDQIIATNPEYKPWLDRFAFAALEGKISGFAESCPKCWRPIWGAEICPLTKHEPCQCGTKQLIDDSPEQHGIPEIWLLMGKGSKKGSEKGSGNRAD